MLLAILKKKWQAWQVKIAVLILAVEFVEVVLEVVVVVEAAHRARNYTLVFIPLFRSTAILTVARSQIGTIEFSKTRIAVEERFFAS